MLVSLGVINCREIKARSLKCSQFSQWHDVSCQGISNDCCVQQEENKDIYECKLAGSSNLQAWYTSTEIKDLGGQLCSKEDELTAGWKQIKAVTGICMNATTQTQAQFSDCDDSHSSWFRFIGNGSFHMLENGEYVGRCLSIENTETDESGFQLPSFDIVPCQQSATEWAWTDTTGLQMRSVQTSPAGPVPRLKDGFPPDVFVLDLNDDGSIIIRTESTGVVNQGFDAQGRPMQRANGPFLRDGGIPTITPIPPPPPQLQILLPPVQTTGNWSDEVLKLGTILDQMINDTVYVSDFLGLSSDVVPTPDFEDPKDILQGALYCDREKDGISVACDNIGRIVSLGVNNLLVDTFGGSLSPAIFQLSRLRNVNASSLGLTGSLPQLSKAIIQDDEQTIREPLVIKELQLQNNQFFGRVPADWADLQSLISVNLSNNDLLGIVSSWIGARAFGIPTTILLDQVQCGTLNSTCEQQVLIDRFPCLKDLCSVSIDEEDSGDDEDDNSMVIIIATLVAVLLFLFIAGILMGIIVRKRRRSMWDTMEMQMAGMKYDHEKGLGKPTFSGRLTPPKSDNTSGTLPLKSGESSLLERYLQEEGIVTWNTPPQYIVDWEIDYERDLKPKGTLGVGAMGTVQLAEWTDRSNGEKNLVAVKIFSRYLQPIYKDAVEVLNQKLILREVEILMRVKHPNIVKCLGAILKPPHMGLVLEYMDVGNLDKYLHNICSAHPINDRDKLIIMKQIARALDHLHPSVVHRDLKPQNILINSAGEIKLSDFGLSKIRQLQDAGRASSLQVIGTAPYTSPEVFRSNGMNMECEKIDIYSLGVIMWEIWTTQRPWEGENMVAISYKVVNEQQRPPMPNNIPARLKNLIESCWDDDPKRRPSARDIQRMLEWMIDETNFNQAKYQEMREQDVSGSLDEDLAIKITQGDSSNHIDVPADEDHESVFVTFIFPDGGTSEGKFDWRDSLLLLTDEVNDILGYEPDGDISRFRLHRIIEIENQDPQIVEVDLTNISDTLQQHGFYTRNTIYVDSIDQ
eukprot:TRINITY_DN2802_c0_g1_i5.p1 TRINITY_DN2802_c0_g1~~TRINITY_DN2802_c0_g1_i5.p1  ORF type:complete len:1176 (+),score=141.00 TRINITY_DN2802_c0_g1_i5:448-3528(+)